MTATLPDNLKPHSTDCNATGADPATPREETLRVCPELAHLRSFVETAAAREAVDPPGQ